MMVQESGRPLRLQRKWLGAAVLLLASLPLFVGVWSLKRVAATSQLNQDEFQHVHVAWNTLRGHVLYRDFFEHHGPLTAWLGSIVLNGRGAHVASLSTFDLFRTLNLSGQCLLFGLVALLVRRTGGTWAVSLSAAGLLATSQLMSWVGVQYRPDTLQNLLVVASLLLILDRRNALAGLCLGLLPTVHPKAVLAVGFVLAGVALSSAVRYGRETRFSAFLRVEWARWAWFMGGLVGVQACVVGFFAVRGGVGDYWRRAWVGNFGSVGRAATVSDVAAASRAKLWMVDKPLLWALVFVFMGAAIVLWKERRDERMEGWLLVSGAAIASLVTFGLPFRAYALLLPLTLMAGLTGVASLWHVGRVRPAALMIGLVTFGAGLRTLPRLRDEPDAERAMQRTVLSRVLSVTPRDEPLFYVWPSRCAAYVFNVDAGYHWQQTTRAIFAVATPEHDAEFDRSFRENVMGGRVRYVALDVELAAKLPAEFRAYLRTHFLYQGCLWERT